MKFLKYSFYRFYHLMNSVGGGGDIVEYKAILLMSLLCSLHTFTIFSILYIVSDINIDISRAPILYSALLPFGLLIFFYFLFVRKDRHLEIAKEYEHETSKKKIIGNVLTIGYILMSIGLLMLGFYLMMLKNRGLM